MKHTNLTNELEMHKPDTTGHVILMAVVIIIAACFLTFVYFTVKLLTA